MTSCVSKKIYNDLENKFTDLKKENRFLSDENDELHKANAAFDSVNKALTAELEVLKADKAKLQADCTATSNNLKTLQDSYAALEKNSNDALETNMTKNRELLAQLDAKEKEAKKKKEAKKSGKPTKKTEAEEFLDDRKVVGPSEIVIKL
jgi:chemotaxis protein MotB